MKPPITDDIFKTLARHAELDAQGVPRIVRQYPIPSGIGDINSTERGSGARFNTGKAPYSLVPIKFMAETYMRANPDNVYAKALFFLGCYQTTCDVNQLYAAVEVLGMDGWEECARVFEYGMNKYAAWNWSKGMSWSVPLECATRHLLKLIDGERLDFESKLSHRGHVFCNLCMLVTFSVTFKEGDDLPPAGSLA